MKFFFKDSAAPAFFASNTLSGTFESLLNLLNKAGSSVLQHLTEDNSPVYSKYVFRSAHHLGVLTKAVNKDRSKDRVKRAPAREFFATVNSLLAPVFFPEQAALAKPPAR